MYTSKMFKNELVQESSSKQAAIQPPFWYQPPISLKTLKNSQLAISIKTLKVAGITNIKILLFTTLGFFQFKKFYLKINGTRYYPEIRKHKSTKLINTFRGKL